MYDNFAVFHVFCLGQSAHKNSDYANLQFLSQKIPSYLPL